MACLLLSLPDDVLKNIMQHVSLMDRLTSCCLVSRRLHAAAVAATEKLVLDCDGAGRIHDALHGVRPKSVKSALGWLCNYGQHLTSLQFRSWPYVVRELRCPNLLELQITRGAVQLGPTANGFPGVIKDCTKLTRLRLSCDISDIPADGLIDCLSSLVHLHDLGVGVATGRNGLSAATLPRLEHLTCLQIYEISMENLLQLSGLTNLQVLDLGEVVDAAGRSVCVPGLTLPASLKTLDLSSYMDVGILSVVPTGLQDLQILCRKEVDPVEGPGSWLSCLGRLQHLTKLCVSPELDWVSPELDWPPAGPVYSALTASSSLVCLEVNDLLGWACPAGFWQYVFPTTRKLSHLTQLTLFDSVGAPHDSMRSPSWCAADLSRLVSCCPSLCDVCVLPLQPGPHVSELHKLTGLTSLIMFHDPTVDTDTDDSDDPDSSDGGFEEAARGLAAVTQLRHLEVKRVSQAVKYGSLLPLTGLTALTRLKAYWVPDVNSDGDDMDDGMFMSFHKRQDGAAPDVWQQLLERCTAEPEGQPKPHCNGALSFCFEALEGLQERLSAQEQAAAQQEQMPDEKQVAQPLFGLQELQELHAAMQQVLPSDQH